MLGCKLVSRRVEYTFAPKREEKTNWVFFAFWFWGWCVFALLWGVFSCFGGWFRAVWPLTSREARFFLLVLFLKNVLLMELSKTGDCRPVGLSRVHGRPEHVRRRRCEGGLADGRGAVLGIRRDLEHQRGRLNDPTPTPHVAVLDLAPGKLPTQAFCISGRVWVM